MRSGPSGGGASAARIAIVVVEAAAVLALLVVWIASPSIREQRNLLLLFLYCFPSEFLVGLVPHEPLLLFYGEVWPALTVALVSAVGTVFAEAINYSVLGLFHDIGWFDAMRRRRIVARTIALFERAPFLAIVVAGFTPIPFAPIRFLVGMTRYSRVRYLAGVFVSRLPRFVLLAWLGDVMHLGPWSLLAVFIGMIVVLYLPVLRARMRRRPATSAAPGLAAAPAVSAIRREPAERRSRRGERRRGR